jgi:DNA invertase Pin-like site-specific DNA recombinase
VSRRPKSKIGKRRLRREARRDVVRILELDEEGHSARAIASSVGLTEEFVREVLAQAEAARGRRELH